MSRAIFRDKAGSDRCEYLKLCERCNRDLSVSSHVGHSVSCLSGKIRSLILSYFHIIRHGRNGSKPLKKPWWIHFLRHSSTEQPSHKPSQVRHAGRSAAARHVPLLSIGKPRGATLWWMMGHGRTFGDACTTHYVVDCFFNGRVQIWEEDKKGQRSCYLGDFAMGRSKKQIWPSLFDDRVLFRSTN